MPSKISDNFLLKIAWAPALVLIVHVIVTIAGLYESYWWFDIPMHFMGGVAAAFSGYYLLKYFEANQKFSSSFAPLLILIIISFVSLSAACWEMMEYTFDLAFHTRMQIGMLDTIKDIAVGIIGGGLTALLIVIKKR